MGHRGGRKSGVPPYQQWVLPGRSGGWDSHGYYQQKEKEVQGESKKEKKKKKTGPGRQRSHTLPPQRSSKETAVGEGRGGKDEGPIDSMEFTLELGEQGGRRGRERGRERKNPKKWKKI